MTDFKRFSIVAVLLSVIVAVPVLAQPHGQGWDPRHAKAAADQLARITDRLYGADVAAIVARSAGDNRTVLLYQYLAQSGESADAWDQGQFGSCVGFATARACSESYAVEVFWRKEHEKWVRSFSPEAAYAMSRMIANQLGNWEGSTGAWACDAIREWGTLVQQDYGEGSDPELDLSKYNIQRLGQWQRKGMPASLITEAKKHPVRATTRVKSTDEAKALLQSGYALVTCSQESYGSGVRDQLGFVRNDGRNGWAHAMEVSAYRGDDTGREGFLIINSWSPRFGSGPKWPEDQPDGSFWVTVASLAEHIAAGDTWAIGDIEGFSYRRLTLREAIDVGGQEWALAP